MPEPWERQPRETDKAFAAFLSYRDTAPKERNLRRLGRESNATVPRWSKKYNWTERARAWDAEQDRIAREVQLSEIADMNKRHIQIAMGLVAKAARRLNTLNENELSPSELRQYLMDAVKLERTARGEAESTLAVQHAMEIVVTFAEKVVRDNPGEGVSLGEH